MVDVAGKFLHRSRQAVASINCASVVLLSWTWKVECPSTLLDV